MQIRQGVRCAGHRLDLRALGKRQGAVLAASIGAALAFGLLRNGESVLWGSLPLPSEPASASVRSSHVFSFMAPPCPAFVFFSPCRVCTRRKPM